MIRNRIEFEVDGVKYFVVKPGADQRLKASIVEAKAFKEALNGGAILRERVTDFLKEQGLLTADKLKEIQDIQRRMEANGRKVPDDKGKVREKGVTKEAARQAALDMATDRVRLQILNADRNSLESRTAEGLAENAKFDYLVSVCAVTEKNETVFDGVEDYQDRINRDDPVALKAANLFSFLHHNLDPDFFKNLPEQKYLKSIGEFSDEVTEKAEEFDIVPDAEDTTVPAGKSAPEEAPPG